MPWQDCVNGAYESLGGFFILLSILKLVKDKKVRGVSVIATAFFSSWGIWNLYYYPHLGQWASFFGGLCVSASNVTWVLLMIHYIRKERAS